MLRHVIQKLLIEGRLEDAQKKYPDVDVSALAAVDPSGRAAKYLMWMAKQIDTGAKSDDVIPTITAFHRAPQKFKYQDINRYTAKQLEDELKDLQFLSDANQDPLISKTAARKQAKSGADVIYQDDECTVRYIGTKAAATQYGKGTRWCITMPDEDYFDSYTKNNNLVFYFRFRNEILGDDNDKIAIAVYRDAKNDVANVEYYDAADKPISAEVADDIITHAVYNAFEQHSKTVPTPVAFKLRSKLPITEDEAVAYWIDEIEFTKSVKLKPDDMSPQIRILSELIDGGALSQSEPIPQRLLDLMPPIMIPFAQALNAVRNIGTRERVRVNFRDADNYNYNIAEDSGYSSIEFVNYRGDVHRDEADGPARLLSDGTVEYRRLGQMHRENGPARLGVNGDEEWYLLGDLHRDGGLPAIDTKEKQAWYIDGKLHREDGPALIVASRSTEIGYEKWYLNGKLHRIGGPAVTYNSNWQAGGRTDGSAYGGPGRREWWVNGKRHNKAGPAVIQPPWETIGYDADGHGSRRGYWVDGVEMSEREWKSQNYTHREPLSDD